MCLLLASIASLAMAGAAAGPRQLTAGPAPINLTETEIAIPTSDTLTLPGVLTLPAESATPLKHRPPIVVLGQGSGVQDRNGTVGPNAFLQQLAWGLAARGIASIRYDRRALVAPANFYGHADLDHEVVIDAAAALEFAAQEPRVDSKEVFYAGHSLSAELGPDIVARRLRDSPGSVRGLILLSGVARPIDVVIREQNQTLGARQGGTPQQIQAMQQAWDDMWALARDPKVENTQRIGPNAATALPASYWRDWLARDPVKTLRTLHIPVLVTRGTYDANTTQTDFELLHAAAKTAGSDAHEFAGLNHLYMLIDHPSDGSDMLQAGDISTAFLDSVAEWIHQTADAVK